jgi:AraC-like DNA-binding protein
MQGLEIWVDWPEPDYHDAWRNRLPPVRFSAPGNLVRLPLSYLDLPTVLADPLASRQAIELCERELEFAAGSEDDIVEQVQHLLRTQQQGYPSLMQLADSLHLSSRTLKRRLQQQGTSFSLMLDDMRHRDARRLLGEGRLPVQKVAERLGYQDPANFTRAFQRWQGETPSQYRQRGKNR